MAAMISAVGRAIAEGVSHAGLLFVVGEEHDSIGAKQAALLEIDSEFIILGEPTRGLLASGQKGTLVFRVRASGVEAHSACPDKGQSAIHLLTEMLAGWFRKDWEEDAAFGKNTLNVGRIDGGVGANVIAGKASAEGIFRVGTSCADLREKVLSFENENIIVEILSSSEPLELYVPAGFRSIVVPFGSDAPYLKPLGRILMLGPGSIEFAHSEAEHVAIRELISTRDQYVNLIKLLGDLER
jgi:acetylornithine deacetylase